MVLSLINMFYWVTALHALWIGNIEAAYTFCVTAWGWTTAAPFIEHLEYSEL